MPKKRSKSMGCGIIDPELVNKKTERQGFEPWVAKGNNGFRDRPVQPLRHLSDNGNTSDILIQTSHKKALI